MPAPPAFELAEKLRFETSRARLDQVLPAPVTIPATATAMAPPGTIVTGLLQTKKIPDKDKTGQEFLSIETDRLSRLQREEQAKIRSTPEAREKMKGKTVKKLSVVTTTNTTKMPTTESILKKKKAATRQRSRQEIEYLKEQRHYARSKSLVSSQAGDAIKGDATDTTAVTAAAVTSFANVGLIPAILTRSTSAPTPMVETHIYTPSTTCLLLPEIPPNEPLTLSKTRKAVTTSSFAGLPVPSSNVLKQQQLPSLTTQQRQEQKHGRQQYLDTDYETLTERGALQNLTQQQASLALPNQPPLTSDLKPESISAFEDIINEESRILETVLPPGPQKPTPYDRFLFKIKMNMYERRRNASRTSSLVHMGLDENSDDIASSTSSQSPFTYLDMASGLASETNNKDFSEINRTYGSGNNPDFNGNNMARSSQAQPYNSDIEIARGNSAITFAQSYPQQFFSNTEIHFSQGQRSGIKANAITGDNNTTAIAAEQVTTDSVLCEEIEALLDLGRPRRLSDNRGCRSGGMERDANCALTRKAATTVKATVATNVNQAQCSRNFSQQHQGRLNLDNSFNINMPVNEHRDASGFAYPILYGSRENIQNIFPPTILKRKPQKKP
jgi:hypothetical protein